MSEQWAYLVTYTRHHIWPQIDLKISFFLLAQIYEFKVTSFRYHFDEAFILNSSWPHFDVIYVRLDIAHPKHRILGHLVWTKLSITVALHGIIFLKYTSLNNALMIYPNLIQIFEGKYLVLPLGKMGSVTNI